MRRQVAVRWSAFRHRRRCYGFSRRSWLDWPDRSLRAVAIFAGVGLLFPATVTFLTFEANRQMGPSVSAALSNLTPLFAVLPAMVLLPEMPHPFQAIGIVAIVIGAVTLSIDRRWFGMSWSYWALALPIGIAAIRGMTQPITKLGLGIWPSPFAATLICYTMSRLPPDHAQADGHPEIIEPACCGSAASELAIVSGFLHFMRHSHEGRCFWCRRLLRPTRWLL